MADSLSGFLRLDWDRVARSVATMDRGVAGLTAAVDLLEQAATGTEETSAQRDLATFRTDELVLPVALDARHVTRS
jgi:hypothetical protein